MSKPIITPLSLSDGQAFEPPKKRLFMGLVVAITTASCLLFVLLWFAFALDLRRISPFLFFLPSVFLGLTFGSILGAALALGLQSVRGKHFKRASQVRAWGVKFFLPLAEFFGKALGYSKDEVRRSFIKVNNDLALNLSHGLEPGQILILLPHCLQKTSCKLRLTYEVDHCRRCGACPLAGLLNLRDRYGVKLAVATGGSVARLIVVQARPKLILAVACERDLASGVQDVYPLPVFGVLNDRPEGPCRNTLVSLDLVEKALRQFILPELLP